MRILVACEESQAVTVEFRNRGIEAWSCDILPTSGPMPQYHIQGDVLGVMDDGWDCIIAFPPCTYLTSAGTRHFSPRMNSTEKIKAREVERHKAVLFFMAFIDAKCPQIAVENPVGYMNTHYRKPDQIIHPYYFGDAVSKRTCLWLKGLPKLRVTNMLPKPEPMYICQGEKSRGKKIGWCEGIKVGKGGQTERAKQRSKTFSGIAKAMATQWGDYLEAL